MLVDRSTIEHDGCASSRRDAPARRWLDLPLRDPRIEACINANSDLIGRDAELAGVDRRTFETQIRLHLPSVSRRLALRGGVQQAYESVRSIALVRAAGIRQELDRTELLAHASLLLPKNYAVKRDLTLLAEDGSRLRLGFRRVLPSIGHVYQSRLHYLRCARSDTFLQFGLFLQGASYPLTYVALSMCDRPYLEDRLLASRLHCRRQECLVLTRMYGLPGIPSNLMSVTVRHVVKVLRKMGRYRLLLTAYNPLLGFTGASFHASGFSPFATAPVHYGYSKKGEFSTRRNGATAEFGCYDAPPNILAVRGVDKPMQRAIMGLTTIDQISVNDYLTKTTFKGSLPIGTSEEWLKKLSAYRGKLERAWSLDTIHPSYAADGECKPSSRGQCGVSSVWLARELRTKYGVDATYCYGDLKFVGNESDAVDHHCWIEVGPRDDAGRLVIDITCDQADSLNEQVLCSTYSDLLSRGISYESRTRLALDELPADRVWHRFMALSDAVESELDPTPAPA